MGHNLVVILGPTASGKTGLAVSLARAMGSEVISADSRQVYRGMDIGTGKDLDEYRRGGSPVPYHLIDIVDPREEFNVFEFQRRFYDCFSRLRARGIVPVLVGGTGLYIESVLKEYEMLEVPENAALRAELADQDEDALTKRLMAAGSRLHNTTDLSDRRRLIRAIEIAEFTKKNRGRNERPARPEIAPLVTGVRFERAELRRRITCRLEERIAAGLIEEIEGLHERGISWERMDAFGLEYRYVGLHLRGLLDKKQMFAELNTRIHQFAKRQETWFRKMERQGVPIHWISGGDYDALQRLAAGLIS
jgi:tRNA dimethylallyltransferase